MIQGVQIEVSHEELKAHIAARAEYHRSKADWYDAQVKSLTAGGLGETRHSNDPVGSLQQSANSHREKMAFFAFLADHLVNDTYRLSESDLSRLEFVSRYF